MRDQSARLHARRARPRLTGASEIRLAVYTGYAYSRDAHGRLHATRAFALFLVGLARRLERMVLVGGMRPAGEGVEHARYPIPSGIELVALPYYESLADPRTALALGSLRRFWRALDSVDAVWVFGPHPLAIVFALLAVVRRRRVFLGMRQDTVEYLRGRYPGRRDAQIAGRALEAIFRALARRFPVVVVGPELARKYARAPRLLEIAVSLVGDADLVAPETALARDYDGELVALSVGRVEAEKNPLLLADALARLNRSEPQWRLRVCGEGDMRDELAESLREAGQADRAELLGYVPFGAQLTSLYRSSHVLLHNSLTEGLPQVLLEAFAAGLPVVASDVGGIRGAVGDAVYLVPPGDAAAAADAVRAVAGDPALRARLVRAGHEFVRERTAAKQTAILADFLQAPG